MHSSFVANIGAFSLVDKSVLILSTSAGHWLGPPALGMAIGKASNYNTTSVGSISTLTA